MRQEVVTVICSTKVLIVSDRLRWRARATRILENRLADDDMTVECVNSMDEAMAAVRQDQAIRCLLIRDNHDERGTLSAIARMITARPDLQFIFVADEPSPGSMSKFLQLGQRGSGRFGVSFVGNSYDYDQLCDLVSNCSD